MILSAYSKFEMLQGAVYTATSHSYKVFLPLPLNILRPATISTLLSCCAICLEQALYKCQWNKWIHFTTPFSLHRCICTTHAPPHKE